MQNKLITALRLKITTLLKGPSYLDEFTRQTYKTYLNHNKVIHYRDGYPVYSLSTPALFSKPAANFFARILYRIIQNRNMPNLMSFALTDTCNAQCAHCSFFDKESQRKGEVMTSQQCKKIIADAQEIGVSIINLLGGEPLMRGDIMEIIKSIDKDLSTVILFTNGWHLQEKAGDLKKAGLDGVYVSIDSADGAEHDKIRNRNGMFEKAMAGLSSAKKAGLSVGISCCITKDDYNGGKLEEIIELGREIGIHEILVFDAIPTGKLKDCGKLIDDNHWINDMIKFTEKYNKDDSYPGILVYAYATSHRSTGCSGGTSYFYVSPFGDISPCDFNHAVFGNALERPLYEIWDEMSSMDMYKQATWGGCKMKNAKYRDSIHVSTEGYQRR